MARSLNAVFFECPIHMPARRRFKLALAGKNISFGDSWGIWGPSRNQRASNIVDFANLIAKCRLSGDLIGDLARYIDDLCIARQRHFRKLSVRDVLPGP